MTARPRTVVERRRERLRRGLPAVLAIPRRIWLRGKTQRAHLWTGTFTNEELLVLRGAEQATLRYCDVRARARRLRGDG